MMISMRLDVSLSLIQTLRIANTARLLPARIRKTIFRTVTKFKFIILTRLPNMRRFSTPKIAPTVLAAESLNKPTKRIYAPNASFKSSK